MAMHVVKSATYTPSQRVDHGRQTLLSAHHIHDDKTVKRHNSHIALLTFNTVSHDLLFLDRRNLYETELSLLADPDYMQNHGADHQPKNYIDRSMRMIVISWLVEVACEYELHQETLFLAVALLDRYMSLAKVLFAYMMFFLP